jgi:hypothetical protein
MAVANVVELSGYVTAMAASARVAQGVLSAGTDPMTVKEFRFKVNIGAEFKVSSETDIGLNIWVLSIKEKLTVSYQSHWGLEIEATIVPTFETV